MMFPDDGQVSSDNVCSNGMSIQVTVEAWLVGQLRPGWYGKFQLVLELSDSDR